MSKRKVASVAPKVEAPTHSPFSWRRANPPGTIRVAGSLPRIHSRMALFLWTMASLAMLCVTVPGVGWWPIAYVCLVPWLVCVGCAARARFLYFLSYLLGAGYFLINVRWMYPVTAPGYFALSFFFALQFPLMAWPIRHLYQKRGLPIAMIAPVAWTAFEFLRCIGPLGFPMLLLGHSQYRVLTMIQISDLVGAYGVSFVLAMINGLFADLLIQPIVIHRTEKSVRMPLGTLATVLVLAGTVIYGISQSSTRHLEDGPLIAMIQQDVPMYVGGDYVRPTPGETLDAAIELSRAAIAEKPDLVVLPETALHGHFNDEFILAGADTLQEILQRVYAANWSLNDLRILQQFARQSRDAFQSLSTESGVSFVIGATATEWRPTAIPARAERYNSAYLLLPGESRPAARNDKRHLVMFGEYVPFRFTIPWVYEQLNSFTPWGRGGRHFSLSVGEAAVTFEFSATGRRDRRFRAGAPICYEEIMPYIAREFARGNTDAGSKAPKKNIDLLVPISNDGWFLHSAELEQHLAAGVFRAVENRIAVARSVNTGASAMIYPNGKVHCRVSLSAEQSARLDAVEAALTRVRTMGANLAGQGGGASAFAAGRQKLAQAIGLELVPAYAAVGPGFRMYGERLDRLQSNIGEAGTLRSTAIATFVAQADDDLAMVRRWRARPDTAPGFAVDRAMLDGRLTWYTRWGDLFSALMLGLTGMVLLDWLQVRIRRNRMIERTREGDAK